MSWKAHRSSRQAWRSLDRQLAGLLLCEDMTAPLRQLEVQPGAWQQTLLQRAKQRRVLLPLAGSFEDAGVRLGEELAAEVHCLAAHRERLFQAARRLAVRLLPTTTFVFLKGFAVERHYRGTLCRQFNDLDVLVRDEGDLWVALRQLSALGFDFETMIWQQDSEGGMKSAQVVLHEVKPPQGSNRPLKIDLAARALPLTWSTSLFPAWIWHRLERLPAARELPIPCGEDLFALQVVECFERENMMVRDVLDLVSLSRGLASPGAPKRLLDLASESHTCVESGRVLRRVFEITHDKDPGPALEWLSQSLELRTALLLPDLPRSLRLAAFHVLPSAAMLGLWRGGGQIWGAAARTLCQSTSASVAHRWLARSQAALRLLESGSFLELVRSTREIDDHARWRRKDGVLELITPIGTFLPAPFGLLRARNIPSPL